MPHFIIECSEDIITLKTPDELMQAVYEVAEGTGLFAENDIKVRIDPYRYFKLGEGKKNFIHVFGNIMEGRSIEQRTHLSKKVVERLTQMLPNVSIISMNISEFEMATYSNKSLIDPRNKTGDRHF